MEQEAAQIRWYFQEQVGQWINKANKINEEGGAEQVILSKNLENDSIFRSDATWTGQRLIKALS